VRMYQELHLGPSPNPTVSPPNPLMLGRAEQNAGLCARGPLDHLAV